MAMTIDVSGVQRLVLRGLRLSCVRHYFLTVARPNLARDFLSSLADRIPSANEKCTERSAAVALTYTGLQALRLRDEYLAAFRQLAPAFVEGAAARAAGHLGDTGGDESPGWEMPFRSPGTHVVLSVHADSSADLDKALQALIGGPLTSGPPVLNGLPGGLPGGLSGWNKFVEGRHPESHPSRQEPFGFRDGISQPTVKGVHLNWARRNPPSMHVEPGEMLLGYPNEDRSNRWSDSAPEAVRAFVTNGSFMALRKMSQDRKAFGGLESAELQAKMCGRWPNGALVLPGQNVQPALVPDQALNKFDFTHDADGLGCPFASHIRRLNPRSDPVISARKRVLMRRGVPYDDGRDIGLLGLFVCADLERQFEFLLNEWGREAPMLRGTKNAPDPLIGARGQASVFPLPGRPAIPSVPLLKSFVTTRGTLYGFYPSLTALANLTSSI